MICIENKSTDIPVQFFAFP